jgi:DNA polymerase-1
MSEKKRFFLVDAFALIFRGYYAFIKNPRINSKGLDTSAIMGFMNSLLDVIKRERPDHLAVCFDKGGSVARKEAFTEYKANRDATPEAIKIAIPYIYEILKAMQIPIMVKEGFEADDVIGTLAKKAEKEGYQTFMVTPDKDFAQLVSENIFMYRPMFGGGYETWGIPEVQNKFGVETPEQVIDFLGMMGDSADNIPGLPGVGEKTAKKFIATYGSMENLLANTHELKGKMKEKVEGAKELGLLSKELARIILDVPVEFNFADFELTQPDVPEVTKIFTDLEFRRLIVNFTNTFKVKTDVNDKPTSSSEVQTKDTKKVIAEPSQLDLFAAPTSSSQEPETISGFKEAKNVNHFYQHINNELSRKLLIKKLLQQKSVCFDTETTGLNALKASLVGISFSYEKGKGYYVPFTGTTDEIKQALEEFRSFFEDESIEKVGQNIKYNIKVIQTYSIVVKGPIFDTMLAHYLINPDMRHNMNVLAETYLNYQPIAIESLIGKKGKNQRSMSDISIEEITEYAVEDADITLQLKEIFEKELEKNNLTKLFKEIEIPLVKVLSEMEIEGVNVDGEFLKGLSKDLTKDILDLESKIYGEANIEFNLASPKQLGEVLFDHLKLVDKPKKTKTGQYKTSEDVLSYLANDHEIVAHILKWRGLIKLKNTYVDALPNEIDASTKRIHTNYSQAVAATGRLSSNNPNLQNIPIRTERGRQVRKAFVPRNENYVLLAADYSQIELRLIAELSGDEAMKNSFLNGEDIHKATAANVFNIPLDEVTREQRSHAKTVNFGIIYGVSAFGLSNQTNLSRKEAKELIENYYLSYPTLKNYISKQVDFARDNGYVETLLGRRRYLKNINSQNAMVRSGDERNAVNAPIQGSAADIIKIAMIHIQNLLQKGNYKSKMLLQVHDELVFDIHKDELEVLKPIIKYEMENAYKLSIPLDVDLDIGENWLDAH